MIFHFNELIFTFLNERYQINRQNYKVENICPFHTIKKSEKKNHGAIKLIWEITKCIFHFLCNSFFDLTFQECILAKKKSTQGGNMSNWSQLLFLKSPYYHSEKYYRENIDEQRNEETKFSRWFLSWIMFVDNCTLTQPSWSTYMSRGMQLYTLLHPPNCNHSHLAKKIFAYLNVPFSIASGKLMVQINYSLKKDKQNIVFVPVWSRFPNKNFSLYDTFYLS